MKRKTLNIMNLILHGLFILSCMYPFLTMSEFKQYLYSDKHPERTWDDYCNLFSSLFVRTGVLPIVSFVLLMLCFVAVVFIHITDISNARIGFLNSEKGNLRKARLLFLLPGAEILFLSMNLLFWENSDYVLGPYSTAYEAYYLQQQYDVGAIAVVPFFLLLMALCASDLYRGTAKERKSAGKKAIVGFVLRIIGILGIFAGVTIHAADDFLVGGFFYIGGAVVYMIGRFLFGFPITEEVEASIYVPDAISELPSNEKNAPVSGAAQNATQAKETANENAAEAIREFKKLLDDGIITQEEFDAKKKQLLGI